jgi:hypothetical protein
MPRIPKSLRETVIESSQGKCAFCHSPERLMGVTFEVDHITPRSAKGKTVVENLCLTCPTCNRHKANRVTAVDPISNRAVNLFHPNQDQWADHFKWSNDGSEILTTTSTGRATVEALQMNRPAMILLRRYWRATGINLDE